MVSLYRAWAACGGAALGGLGAPDALVHAGGVRFAAHCRLLAAHSGYFKSVLPPAEDPKRAPSDSNPPIRYDPTRNDQILRANEETVVHIPNISAQQFWPLLAYMYTGYLELSPENIYQVLLATHLLHMPRALELCRSFLAQGRSAPPQTPATVVVKPIASRKLPPYLPPPASFRPLHMNDTLVPSSFMRPTHDTPFRPIEQLIPLHFAGRAEEPQFPILINSTELNIREESVITNTSMLNRNEVKSLAEIHSHKENKNVSDSEDSRSSLDVITTPEAINIATDAVVLLKNKSKTTPSKVSIIIPKPSVSSQEPKEKESVKVGLSTVDDKIVMDVACCDGPVRFHRVLNTAYSGSGESHQDASDSEDSYVEIEEDTSSPYDNCNAFSRSLQKQMSEDIRTMKRDENRPGREGDEPARYPAETIYTCVYCNHTFKSQYCYQKHARRHLNPVSIDAVNRVTPDTSSETCCKARRLSGGKAPAAPGPRREVRLLDMNVQYYPCKTCGSKFPSYYFVHKHRKMCHAEEMDGSETAGKPPVGTEKKKKASTSGNEVGEVGIAVREIVEVPEEQPVVIEAQEKIVS